MDTENLEKIVKSEAYKKTAKKIKGLKQRLEDCSKEEVIKIRDEKIALFNKLNISNPFLYRVFKLDEKTLNEKIIHKLSGLDIIID